MQKPGNRKPRKKKVSFANHAMVLDFNKEDATEKIQYNAHAQMEEALSGSYLQDSFSTDNPPNAPPQSYYDPRASTKQRAYSFASSIGNDDDFLANTFASQPQASPQHYSHQTFNLSPNPPHQAMDIDQDENEDDDDDMELTGTYSVTQPQNIAAPTPEIQGLNDLYDNEDTQTMDYTPALQTVAAETTLNAESLQDLFDNDDDTKSINASIPPQVILPQNESTSFNTETQHLQINAVHNRRPSSEFAATNDDVQVSMDEILCDSTNNGSFNDASFGDNTNNTSFSNTEDENNGSFRNAENTNNEANKNTDDANNEAFEDNDNNSKKAQITAMPALESPLNERNKEPEQDNIDNNDSFFGDNEEDQNTSSFFTSPTHDMRVSDPLAVNDEDHTLCVNLPQHLMNTPQKEVALTKSINRRPSSANLTEHIMPVRSFAVDSCNLEELNSSLLSETTANLGSVTRKFRTKVIVNNKHNDNEVEETNEDELDASFNTMLHNVGALLHEKYGLVQGNNEAVNASEFRQVVPDKTQVRNEQQEHEYVMEDNNVDDDDDDDRNGDNMDEVVVEEEEAFVWREIATKYEWYEVKSKKPLKYSLGLGITQQNTHSNHVLTNRKDIVLQEMCDKVELKELQKFSEAMNDKAVRIDNEIVDLEAKMDDMNEVTKENIKKYGMNQDTQRLTEYFRMKSQNEFDEAKLKCLTNINDEMSVNYEKLCEDLEALNAIYDDVDNKCVSLQNNINALKQCETNQHLRNLQQKIFANDKEIEMEQTRKEKYNELIAYEKNKTHHLEKNISEKTERIKYLKEEIERSTKYEEECEEITDLIDVLHSITGIQLNRMTSNVIELILCREISFCMEYDAKTQKVFNIKWTKHQKATYTDALSPYLINMAYEIGNVLEIKTKVKTISDLKAIIWDIVELITGITEIRRDVTTMEKMDKDKNSNFKFIVKPMETEPNKGKWNLKVAIKGVIEYSNANNERMKSSLLVQSVFDVNMGHPHNKIHPQIGVVLLRQIYDANKEKYKSVKDRVSQMLIERQLCKLFEEKFATIRIGTHLLIRCIKCIKYHMNEILTNETNSN